MNHLEEKEKRSRRRPFYHFAPSKQKKRRCVIIASQSWSSSLLDSSMVDGFEYRERTADRWWRRQSYFKRHTRGMIGSGHLADEEEAIDES